MFELKKIGIIRRLSALLLDAILLAVLATGFMWIIDLICKFSAQDQKLRNYRAQMDEYRTEYFADIADNYGFRYEEDENGDTYTIIKIDPETKAESPSDADALIGALDADKDRSERMQEAYEAYQALPTSGVIFRQRRLVLNMLFMMVSIGVLLAYLILEFILPIILKNGQTVGKKVFSICLVKPNCVKMPTVSLFARTFLGKFAIETMFPILLLFLFMYAGTFWLSIILFVAITLLNVILFFATKNKTPIHDILSGTVAVDMKLQMIYATEEELAARKAERKEFLPSSKD